MERVFFYFLGEFAHSLSLVGETTTRCFLRTVTSAINGYYTKQFIVQGRG
jgi:hypothetical protein